MISPHHRLNQLEPDFTYRARRLFAKRELARRSDAVAKPITGANPMTDQPIPFDPNCAPDGYVAKLSETCDGCAHNAPDSEVFLCGEGKCSHSDRPDGQGAIFKTRPPILDVLPEASGPTAIAQIQVGDHVTDQNGDILECMGEGTADPDLYADAKQWFADGLLQVRAFPGSDTWSDYEPLPGVTCPLWNMPPDEYRRNPDAPDDVKCCRPGLEDIISDSDGNPIGAIDSISWKGDSVTFAMCWLYEGPQSDDADERRRDQVVEHILSSSPGIGDHMTAPDTPFPELSEQAAHGPSGVDIDELRSGERLRYTEMSARRAEELRFNQCSEEILSFKEYLRLNPGEDLVSLIPEGLRPASVVREARIFEIIEALHRYSEATQIPPHAWVTELRNLIVDAEQDSQ